MEIYYIERKTGQKCKELVYGYKILLLLYGDGFFRNLISRILLPIFSLIPLSSRLYGLLQKLPQSARKIKPFIEKYQIDASEFETMEFRSFNDFFIRRLKKEKRPVVEGKARLAMPADGRYLVYPRIDRFVVKEKEFSLGTFLQNQLLAQQYSEGSMAIVRLCPVDYHRFHFPCDGTASKAQLINGPLYSVNPIALRKRISILCENKRVITELNSEGFGKVQYVEVGATSVGSIHQTYQPDTHVKKGDEKGYFEFGGSCIVLLFEKNRVVFDKDLVENSAKGLETRANFGQSLGQSLLFSPNLFPS
jgi:phosphatidylserine decarboxylase